MRAIGFWLESLQDTNRIPPHEVVRPLPDDVRRALSDYLEQGDVYESYRGESWCRFHCDRSMGSRELSDGRWYWPEDLGHYVRDHGITLPGDFIDHVFSGTPRIPRSAWAPSADEHGDWERWCRENASEAYWQRLEQARQAAGVRAQQQLASEIARREREIGVSVQPCMHSGCATRALNGMAICASCWTTREAGKHISYIAYQDLGWLMEMYRGPGPRTVDQIIFDIAEHQREEDYTALCDALRGCELQVPVEARELPPAPKWLPRFMRRPAAETRMRLIEEPSGEKAVLAFTPAARAEASVNFVRIKWSDLLARVLEVQEAAWLVLQGTTSYVGFDKQRIRHILNHERM